MRDLRQYGVFHVADHCLVIGHEATPENRRLTAEDRTWRQIAPIGEDGLPTQRMVQILVVLNRLQIVGGPLRWWMGVERPAHALTQLPDPILHAVFAWLATPEGLAELRAAAPPPIPADATVYVDADRISGRD